MADQKGVFEAAHEGTLFLDEIGDIPLRAQNALLRVLEQHEIVRLGETQARAVDVRVLAASHKDLLQEVQAGRFREDLYYRLNVIRLEVPPLRERSSDVPMLVNRFLAVEARQGQRQCPQLNSDAMNKLMRYHWPGNVRQLRNAVNFMLMSARGDTILTSNLPPELILAPAPLASAQDHQAERAVHKTAIGRAEIDAAIAAANGNRSAAAHALGISRATLYRKLAELLS